jgi:hypothetical protein
MHEDTLYVDLARYKAQSVSVLKSLFRYWFEAAAWHRPTILIFDNMEALLGAELEVRAFSFCCCLFCYLRHRVCRT